MPPFGPTYCETPLAAFSFPAEPINFLTNGVILLFGLIALAYAARHTARADVWVLAVLLTATGVGSALWHGLRTPLSLVLDVVPGLLFLFVFVYAWARRMWGVRGAAGFFGLFFVGTFALSWLTQLLIPFRGPPLGVVVAVLIAAGYLIWKTRARYGDVALWGVVSVGLSLLAFFFRSIDLYTCAVIPFGTHFLWHIFLSASAFVGILLIQKLDKAKNPA